MWSATITAEGGHSVSQDVGETVENVKNKNGRKRGPKRRRSGSRNFEDFERENSPVDYPPIVRPIFDWSEVGEDFPQAAPQMDYSLLSQLLEKKAQDISPSLEEQSRMQGYGNKIVTIVENMILTGEGEQLCLEEVKLVGSHKKGTTLKDSKMADLVILFKELPKESIVAELAYKIKSVLDGETTAEGNTANTITSTVNVELRGTCFDLIDSSTGLIVRVFSSSTGHVIYGTPPHELGDDYDTYTHSLRMIRHSRWWQNNTDTLTNVCSLVRIIKNMKEHVPGLFHLNTWYIELLCHCSLIPLNGGEPLSLVDGFRRLFQLLAAGLFLPGSIGLPDPCEEGDDAIHENLLPEQCEELTSNCQMILVLIQFGAYREILALDGAQPAKLSEPYSFGGLTLNVAPPAYLTTLDV